LVGFNPLSNQLSLSAWIKTSSSGKEVIATMGRNLTNNDGEWIWGISSGKLYFWDYRGGYGFVETSVSTTSVNNGQWRHVAFVRNELTGTFYVDGTPAGTVTAIKNVSYTNSDLAIGGDYRDGTLHWTGQLDDISVTSTALTPAQILLLGSPFTYTTGTNGGLTITGYTGTGGNVEIPATIGGVAVTTIGQNVFQSKTSVTSVVIPNGVTTILDAAFAGCSSMTAITLPNSLTSIGDYVFDGCSSLQSITIPDGVISIGPNAFAWCTSLASITLPSGLKKILSGTFWTCNNLTSITIPGGVDEIQYNAFLNCSKLASVYFLGNTPPTIGVNAFSGIASGAVGYYPATASVVWGSVTVAGLTVTPFGQVNRAPVILSRFAVGFNEDGTSTAGWIGVGANDTYGPDKPSFSNSVLVATATGSSSLGSTPLMAGTYTVQFAHGLPFPNTAPGTLTVSAQAVADGSSATLSTLGTSEVITLRTDTIWTTDSFTFTIPNGDPAIGKYLKLTFNHSVENVWHGIDSVRVFISGPSTLGIPGLTEDVTGNLLFSGTPFSDVDSSSLTVTLSVDAGTITGNAGTGITVGGTGTARTFAGTVADLNAYFITAGKITYLAPQDFSGSKTIGMLVSDGELTANGSATINVQPRNDAPTLAGQSTTYDALAEFIDGPTLQSANSRWQYLGGNVSALALLGNWKTTGNEVIQNQPQWDGNSGYLNNYPFVQRINSTTGPVPAGSLVIHPSNMEEANRAVAIGWKNTSVQTVAANFHVNLRLPPYGSNDGIDYKLQRGLAGSSRYLLIRSGLLENGGSVALASDALLEMRPGEMIYLIVDSKNNFYADHTEVSAFTVTVFEGVNLDSISGGTVPASNPGTAVTVLTAAYSDDDSGALKGIAITGVDTSHGIWEYTLNGGNIWNSLNGVSLNSARLLKSDAQHRVRFVPNANFSGNAEIRYQAWDQTSGEDGALADLTAVGGGAWVLVAYGANASLGAFLTGPSGSFSSSARTGSAVLPGSLDILKNSMELAMTWTASGGSLPSGGIGSYTHGIAFALPNPAGMNFDGSASSPLIYNNGANPLNSSFAVGSSSPDQSLVNVRTLVGSPGMPSQMYLRNKTFGAGYGGVYGLVMNDGSNAQLDYSQVPDSQTFKAVYLDHGTGSEQGQGLVMGGSGGASNSYVPSTMALWARLDPLQVLALSGGNPISSSGNYLLDVVSTSYVDLIDFDASGAFSAETATGTIQVLDTSAPVINLIGANPLEIYKGATFSDPGATVTDNADATRTIAGTGEVNTATVGNYTLNYNVTDAAGNPAVQMTRTVNVVLDPNGDEDGDGVTNEVEIQVGTSPVDKPAFPETAFVVTFNGSSTQRVIEPRPVQDDFSLAFWIKTAQAGTGSTHWFEGRGLLDGEVGGVTNDFGTSLMAGGKIGFGVGNPDITLISSGSVNNGAWRHIVVTRQASTGAMRIYVDGVLDRSGIGPTGTKSAPSRLTLGSLQTNINYFQGEMADFRIYDRVISTEDVWLLANRLSVSGSEAVATLLIDVDSDGLDDAIDPDPTKLDTDGDGLTDGQEVNTFGSSPSLADTDGDGANDKLEVDLGKSPTVANVYNRLINGSFEDGTVKPSPGGNLPTHQDNVPGWKTTANNNFTIELWGAGFTPSGSGGSSGGDGNVLAELNYIASGTLYQDVIMTVGTTVSYSFLHRGRSGTETIEFRIDRLVGGPGSAVEANFFNRQVSTGNGAWVRYRGTPSGTVQAGKTYRFSYASIFPDGGSGNLLDGASFEIDQDADGLTDSVETNTGTYVSANNTGTDPLDFDSDNDGLKDGEEVVTYGTNPVSADTDSDGAPDGVEVTAGTNPKLNSSLPRPGITLQPVSITRTSGEGVTFSVTATNPAGSPSALTYQWYKNGTAIPTGTNSTLIISPLTIVEAGNYSVVVSNLYGAVTSNIAILTVNKATPTIMAVPTATPISYGQDLASSILNGGSGSVAGAFAFTTPSTAPSVGTATQSVTFRPSDTANYNTVTTSVSVTVSRATPTINPGLSASAIAFGQSLSSSSLSGSARVSGTAVAGTFAFTTPSTAPNAGTASQNVTFTPTETANYNTVTTNVSVTVSRATPTINPGLSASAIVFGQTLVNSSLSGSASVNGTVVAGTFAFTTPSTAPNAGTVIQDVTFTPSDTANYNSATASVSVTVNAALISSGFSHTLYLGAGAYTVTAWGLNTDGRLGVGDMNSPVNWAKAVQGIPIGVTVDGLSAGGTHSLILAGGEVYAAGSDRFGQLGQGAVNGANKASFTPVVTPSSTPVAVAAGGNHSLIVTAAGEVFACGDNTYGQLAQPAAIASLGTWSEVIFPGLSTKIVSVVAGADHNLAVDEDGGVWVWGRNDSGQLGKNTRTSADRTPVRILSSGAKSLAAGYAHSLILKQDGSVLGFGRNTLGQTGHSSGTSYAKIPTPISGLSGIRSIAAGTDSSFAIDQAGQLRSWGYNAYGELLLGNASPSSSPAVYGPTPSPIATNVSNVAGGGYSSLAVGAQGVIFGGRNDVGQAGNGPDPDEVVGDYYYGAGNLPLTNLTMDLAGTTETLYDQIFVGNGAVTLNGILNLMFVGTYTGPVYGSTQTFDLIWAKNGIVLGTGYQLAFNQAGYLVESAVADKSVEGVSGKVLQATIRAVVTAADLAKAVDLARPSLDGVESVSYGGSSGVGIRTLSVSPGVEMIYSYERPTGGVSSGAQYFVNGITYRVEQVSSLTGVWGDASVSGTTVTPLGNGGERVTLRISSSGGAGFLRLQVENPQANGINAGVGNAITN
jgi:alpha-tubulin suppressor-like RCC1 family protein